MSLGELHSNLSQTARLDALEKFRSQGYAYLVATDVAGRGLDIVGVDVVINYDAPPSLDTYLHRIGRTARAGAEGRAVTFVTDANRELLREIVTSTKQQLTKRVVPEEVIAYYDQQLQLHQRHLKLVEKQEMETERLEVAEVEAQRAIHAIEHEKEIFARPPRTWFQTDSQRKAARKLALLEDQPPSKINKHQGQQSTPNKKRVKKGEHQPTQNSGMVETNAVKGRVRAIKRLHRMYEAQGSNTSAASRLANTSSLSSSGKKRRLKDSNEEGFLQDPTDLFRKRKKMKRALSVDANEGRTRVYAGGQKSSRVVVKGREAQMAKAMKRNGKGRRAFKGRSKYKRR